MIGRADESSDRDEPLDAGGFDAWLDGMQAALRGDVDSDVPCGDCTACCRSSQFVHIAPDERDALAHIPKRLLFAAPLMPAGHVLMGYDETGACPMLVDGGCSIYEHRPRTCRTYDCRVFPASGLEPDDKPLVTLRTRRWRFTPDDDPPERAAMRAAATFLTTHPELFDGALPNTTVLAVMAVELHALFVEREPTIDEVLAALRRPPEK